jgi:hypothetical protein
MSLVDQLLAHAEKTATRSDDLKTMATAYSKIMRELPRIFPVPDDIYVKSSVPDYDIGLAYTLRPDEYAESLRKILSIFFGAKEWCGEIVGRELTLRAVVDLKSYTLVLRIHGVNLQHYELTNEHQAGSKRICDINCIKFMPWESIRPEVSSDCLVDYLAQLDVDSYTQRYKSKLLSELATILPRAIPEADEITAAIGLDYDVELTYLCDPQGKKRQYFDKHLGYYGWTATVDKKTADFSLHTLVDIKCKLGIIRVCVSILDACQHKEHLFLLADFPQTVVYRALRLSDPDYDHFSQIYKEMDGHG